MTPDRLQELQRKHRSPRLFSYGLWHHKCVEPVKRNGEWQIHRFEIKGGISLRDSMTYDMAHQRNPFLDLIVEAA